MNRYVSSILAAGILWGTMGVFVRRLSAMGLGSGEIAILRCSLACLMFGATALICDRRLFKIKLRDIWCFLGSGVCSMLFFSYCYYTTIKLTSMSTASILLYTAPSFVMLMSLFLLRERLTAPKLVSLVMAFVGCCLVSGVGGGERLTLAALLFGLGAGIGYALYSIFGRLALDRGYDSRTVNFYSCLFAALGALLLWDEGESVRVMFSSGSSLLWCLAMGLVSCYLPYLLYTYGLSGVETGRASIMASAEPVVATLLGAVIYHERLSLTGALGIALVVCAIVVLNLRFRRVAGKPEGGNRGKP